MYLTKRFFLPHFMAVEAWGGEEAFKKNQKIDKLKDEFARLNGWEMLRIPYQDFQNIEIKSMI